MLRILSAFGDPPGSRVVTTSCPKARSLAARRSTCVLLPAPSPPSNVMNRGGLGFLSDTGDDLLDECMHGACHKLITCVESAPEKCTLFYGFVGNERHLALQEIVT